MSAAEPLQWPDVVVPGVGMVQIPAELADVLAEVRRLRSAAAGTGSPLERAAWLVGLQHLIDAAQVTFTDVLARFDAEGDASVLSGASSTASWLSHRLRLAPGDASTRVRIARAAPELGGCVDAVAAGHLRHEHLRVMEKALRPIDQPAQRRQAVRLLADLAQRVDPGRVAVAGRRLREVLDPDGALAGHERQFARRCVTIAPLLDGMSRIDGLLDAEATATLTAALAPLMTPDGPLDSRTAAQRRADGLVELAAAAMRENTLPRLAGAPICLDVIVPVATLAGTSTEPGVVLDHPGGPATLSATAVERLGCDASIGRVVLGPGSVPVDVGRRVRHFTAHQRRALAVRDGGCRFPGCTRPPRHTDAHHVIPWSRGGPSDLCNAVLLCRHHHRLLHEGGFSIIGEGGRPDANRHLWFEGPRRQLLPSPPRGP